MLLSFEIFLHSSIENAIEIQRALITLGSVYQEHGQIEDDDGSKALPVHPEVLRKSFLFREDSKTEEYWNKTQKSTFQETNWGRTLCPRVLTRNTSRVKMIADSINLWPHLACSQGAVVWVCRRRREQGVVPQGRGWLRHPALKEFENIYFCLQPSFAMRLFIHSAH